MLEPPIVLTFGVAQVFGLLGVVFVILAAVDDNDSLIAATSSARRSFVWHPLLMTLGMVYLFGCSAVMFRVLRFADKIVAKIVHAGLHTVVVALALAGLSLAVMFKDSLATPLTPAHHFNTLHGIFGLLTVVLYTIQWLVSLPVFLWPKAPDKFRAPGLSVHVCMGVAVFLSAAVTAISGFNQKATTLSSTSTGIAYLKTAAFFYFFYVLVILYMVTLTKYKRPPDF